MGKLFLLFPFFVLMSGCVSVPKDEIRKCVQTSVSEITAHAQRYDGKKVALTGFVLIEFEFGGIFSSKADACMWKTDTGRSDFILIGRCAEGPWRKHLEEVNDDYVRIEGTVCRDRPGKGMIMISEITRFSRQKKEPY